MGAKLRAVGDDEKRPPRPKKKTITEAAASGTVREQLVALRDRVAKTVEDPNCPPRDLAALSKRMIEITKEIDAIDERARAEGDDDGSGPAEDEEWEAI